MLFEWIWKRRHQVDAAMLEVMERMAVASEKSCEAAEKQAAAVVASHQASAKTSAIAAEKFAAEKALAEEELQRLRDHDIQWGRVADKMRGDAQAGSGENQ